MRSGLRHTTSRRPRSSKAWSLTRVEKSCPARRADSSPNPVGPRPPYVRPVRCATRESRRRRVLRHLHRLQERLQLNPSEACNYFIGITKWSNCFIVRSNTCFPGPISDGRPTPRPLAPLSCSALGPADTSSLRSPYFVRRSANTSMCWHSPRCCSPCIGVRRMRLTPG